MSGTVSVVDHLARGACTPCGARSGDDDHLGAARGLPGVEPSGA